jgi:phosphate starvation-inducible PhoH-like protein
VLADPVDNQRLANLCGALDENLRQIENRLRRDHRAARRALHACAAIRRRRRRPPWRSQHFYAARRGTCRWTTSSSASSSWPTGAAGGMPAPVLLTRKPELHGRTPRQVSTCVQIQEHDITFGIGPAGTGKTYLAVASAVDAFERDTSAHRADAPGRRGRRAARLPAGRSRAEGRSVPAAALRRALRPDGLRQGGQAVRAQAIEIAPLAFMRGRTLNHAFIILDEAQNTTPEQMKMFLTRIGIGARRWSPATSPRSTSRAARRAA